MELLHENPGSVQSWRKLDIAPVFAYTEIDKALLTALPPLPVIPGLFVTHEQFFCLWQRRTPCSHFN
jgi:hypothetical protein